MGGITGDNIEGLGNFAAFADDQGVGTVALVASKENSAPVVESVVIALTGGSAASVVKVQVVDVNASPDAVIDQVELAVAASGFASLAATRIKMNSVLNAKVQAIITGTSATASIHVDGRWISGTGPNFS